MLFCQVLTNARGLKAAVVSDGAIYSDSINTSELLMMMMGKTDKQRE